MKEFVLPRAGNGNQQILEFLMCDTQLNLLLVFQDYLVYGCSVKYEILVSLGYFILDQLQFLRK